MGYNKFFKPTPLYKEFMILDLIEKNKNITQREISIYIYASVSMVNYYLDIYERNGLITRKKITSKTVQYFVSRKGKERKKLLNIWYLQSAQSVYSSAKDNIATFLNSIASEGFKTILLYGAGEVAEIILDVIQNDKNIPLEVIAVIDDDLTKENDNLKEKRIISPYLINNYKHDGILISSYTHHNTIYDKLIKNDYDKSKIINFFN